MGYINVRLFFFSLFFSTVLSPAACRLCPSCLLWVYASWALGRVESVWGGGSRHLQGQHGGEGGAELCVSTVGSKLLIHVKGEGGVMFPGLC